MQIICLGDSITDCNHLFEDFPLGNGYVQILSEMFRNQTPSFSISGDTVGRSSSAVQLTDKSTGAIHFRNCGIDGFTVARVLENIRPHRIFLHRRRKAPEIRMAQYEAAKSTARASRRTVPTPFR